MTTTKKNKFHAVQWLRKVRDEQARLLADKSDDQIIAFFKSAAAGQPGKAGSSNKANTSMRAATTGLAKTSKGSSRASGGTSGGGASGGGGGPGPKTRSKRARQ